MALASIVCLKSVLSHGEGAVFVNQVSGPFLMPLLTELIRLFCCIRFDPHAAVIFQARGSVSMEMGRNTHDHFFAMPVLYAVKQGLKLCAVPRCIKQNYTIRTDHVHTVRRHRISFKQSKSCIDIEVSG